MKKIFIVILLFYFSFFSCSKPLCGCIPAEPPIKAVVTEVNNIDCNRPVIIIDPSDTARLNRMTGVHTDTYIASQLPAALKVVSQKIYIEIGFFAAGEDFACTSMGPVYPHLKVVMAVERN